MSRSRPDKENEKNESRGKINLYDLNFISRTTPRPYLGGKHVLLRLGLRAIVQRIHLERVHLAVQIQILGDGATQGVQLHQILELLLLQVGNVELIVALVVLRLGNLDVDRVELHLEVVDALLERLVAGG